MPLCPTCQRSNPRGIRRWLLRGIQRAPPQAGRRASRAFLPLSQREVPREFPRDSLPRAPLGSRALDRRSPAPAQHNLRALRRSRRRFQRWRRESPFSVPVLAPPTPLDRQTQLASPRLDLLGSLPRSPRGDLRGSRRAAPLGPRDSPRGNQLGNPPGSQLGSQLGSPRGNLRAGRASVFPLWPQHPGPRNPQGSLPDNPRTPRVSPRGSLRRCRRLRVSLRSSHRASPLATRRRSLPVRRRGSRLGSLRPCLRSPQGSPQVSPRASRLSSPRVSPLGSPPVSQVGSLRCSRQPGHLQVGCRPPTRRPFPPFPRGSPRGNPRDSPAGSPRGSRRLGQRASHRCSLLIPRGNPRDHRLASPLGTRRADPLGSPRRHPQTGPLLPSGPRLSCPRRTLRAR